MYKKILCPVDFSPCSKISLDHAAELARVNKASLVLVHVTPPPPAYVSGFAGYGPMTPYHPEPDARLEQLSIADTSVSVSRVHLVGIEGEAIVKYAQRSGCDLIVMGSHGHGAFTRFVVGSVADYVLRHAKCATYVIRDAVRERNRVESNETASVTS